MFEMDAICRYTAALYIVDRSVAEYITQGRVIVAKTAMSAYITNPTPSLVLVTQHLDTLEGAAKAAFQGPKSATAARNAALFVVRCDLRQLKSCVQAAADADVVHSQAIIESTGFRAVRPGSWTKPDIAVKHGPVPGAVVVTVRAFQGKGSHHWQMSTDQKTWIDLPETTSAKTTVVGLTAGTLYAFRHRTLTRIGLSEWSTVVTIIAL
jgi:hypothetical protein